MTHTRKNKGTCSSATTVEIENGIIKNVEVTNGCDGNLKGVCTLLAGMPAKEAVSRIKGLTCDTKPTSCPDQIAHCIEEAIAKE